MNTFIRVAEVWVPSDDGTLLELAGGLFSGAPTFGALSRDMCFGRGEGLPGRAWEAGRPLLLKQIEGSYFRRAAAAQASGLHCAVALPIFKGEQLTSVVVLLCGASESLVGAIELWHNDPRITGDLTLADGYFGANAPALEALSHDSYLPRGSGLPGLAWQREAAVFMDQLGESPRFLRAQEAAQVGIVRGLALPCSSRGSATWVLSLLSSQATPIARRVESWVPSGEAGALHRAFGFCESAGTLPRPPAQMPEALGAIGRAWRSGVAQASTEGETLAVGLSEVLAIPVMADGGVTEVVALYF